MPTIKVQAQDGKFLSIPVDSGIDSSQYDGIVEDALQHYHGSIHLSQGPKQQTMINGQPYTGPKEEGQSPYENPLSEGLNLIGDTQQKAGNYLKQKGEETSEQLGQSGIPSSLAAIPGTLSSTAGALLAPETTMEKVGSMAIPLLTGIGRPISNAVEEAGSSKGLANALAPLGKAEAAIPEHAIRRAITNSDAVWDAPSIEEATKNYINTIPGLKNKSFDLADKLGKTVIDAGDYKNAINEAGQALKEGSLDPQSALTGLQSINKALKSKPYLSQFGDSIGPIMKLKGDLLGYLESNGGEGITEASQGLYDAHVKDMFSSWLPQNQNLSPNALRSMVAGSAVIKGVASSLASGNPLPAVAGAGVAASMSPRMWGLGLRGISGATQELGGPQLLGFPTLSKATNSLSGIMADERGSLFPGNNAEESISDAKFIGIQKGSDGSSFPLFNITKPGHELEGSTVGSETLSKLGLKIPSYETSSPVISEFSKILGRPVTADTQLTQGELTLLMNQANNKREILSAAQSNAGLEDLFKQQGK